MKKITFLFLIITISLFNTLKAQNTITGTVIAGNGKTFTLSCEKTDLLPTTTDTCRVSKDISGTKNPFGIVVQSGWMGVADAFFVSKKGNVMVFAIIRETSNIVINGKKQEHFVNGKKMKIVWN